MVDPCPGSSNCFLNGMNSGTYTLDFPRHFLCYLPSIRVIFISLRKSTEQELVLTWLVADIYLRTASMSCCFYCKASLLHWHDINRQMDKSETLSENSMLMISNGNYMSTTNDVMNFNLVISPQFKNVEFIVNKLVTHWPLGFLPLSWL